ncbi:tail protein X [Kaistia nematophila]|uniref:Tail protein X n=1 Tax=Kaistia nematophila TaxID=2994654 RepID=A0A9X3E5H6_9HYPH|nr:tail protein X [Kaistia nematophila]MCX5571493.1 tail protein X [Kaistia nematophila]
MAIYTTRQGDMIDAICTRTYGDESGYVEIVLAANPGLAALGMPLPIGTVIDLPEIAKAREAVAVVSLWS